MKPIKHLVYLAGVAGGLFAATAALASGNPTGTNSPTATAPVDGKAAAGATNQAPSAATAAPAPETAVAQPAEVAPVATPTAPAVQTATVPAPAATVPAQDAGTNSAAEFPANQGLRMNFRGVPLEMVLNYMSKAAGFIINVTKSIDVKGKVDIWSAQPLEQDEAVELLKKILNQNGYSVMQDN